MTNVHVEQWAELWVNPSGHSFLMFDSIEALWKHLNDILMSNKQKQLTLCTGPL